MKRLTITVEESIYDKLPRKGKSGAVNLILKHYYQKEGWEQLYATVKKKLMYDQEFLDHVRTTQVRREFSENEVFGRPKTERELRDERARIIKEEYGEM